MFAHRVENRDLLANQVPDAMQIDENALVNASPIVDGSGPAVDTGNAQTIQAGVSEIALNDFKGF